MNTKTVSAKKNEITRRMNQPSEKVFPAGFSKEQWVNFYKTMLLSRLLDEKMLILLKQGKSYFHIGCSGHEAAQVAMAAALKPAYDWAYPYYRDQAFTLQFGMTAEELMLCFLARAEDPNSGGRQMPQHYGNKKLRIVTQSSPTGTQYLQAVGCALGAKNEKTDEVVYVSSGEGTTSQGDFHEAINWSAREHLPVIFFIENNKFAISVPVEQQTAGGSVYEMVSGYQGLHRFKVDGTDFIATHQIAKTAVDLCRKGKGPVFIEAELIRLLPHSSSDDQKKYRTSEDLARDRGKDPILRMKKYLVENRLVGEKDLEEIQVQIKKRVDDAADFAEGRPHPEKETAIHHVYSMNPPLLEYEKTQPAGKNIVLVDAINHALDEELIRNPRMIIYGEDVQDPKGGVFTATKGLTVKHGVDRVFNSPLAESSIVGTAIGLATRGWKPVVEIQFGDYVWPAMMQIRNELTTIRYRSNGAWGCPAVIRIPIGGYIHGALCHSQNIESFFAHVPGVYIALPSNAADAKGLLKSACRMDDPVLFLEHKGMYRQGFAMAPEPDDEYLLPFGKAAIKREGTNITVVTYGMMVQRSLEAAKKLEEKGISVEVIDIRTINPLDTETIFSSVRKTNKVLVVHEDTLFQGFGAEIAAEIADTCFEYLDAPVRRVAAKDSPIPYNWYLEEEVLPQEEDIIRVLEELSNY